MYVLKLCYEVLKLEVNNSVAGADFFPVLFRLVNLIFELVKLIDHKTCINLWTCKTNFCKESFSDKKHVLTLIWFRLKISRKNFYNEMSHAHFPDYII